MSSSTAPALDADLARRMLGRLSIMEQQLAPLKAKATRFDAFLAVDGTASLTEAAKMLGMTAIALAKWLRGDALLWLFQKNGGNGGPNLPMAEVIKNGWMVVKAARSPYDGRLHSSPRFTAKGLDALYAIVRGMKESLTPVPSGDICNSRRRHILSRDRHIRSRWDRIRGIMELSEDEQFIPRMLRHACATRLARHGIGMPVIKEWTGHAGIQTTMRYAHLAPSDLTNAAKALNA